MEELVEAFDLKRVNKAGARFDPEKIKWFNHHYMQQQSNAVLAESFKSQYDALNDIDINYIALVVGLIKERATFISDFWDLSFYFFQAPKQYDEKAVKKAFKEDTPDVMTQLLDLISAIDEYTSKNLQITIKSWITSNEMGFGKIMMPLRLALVGALQGPDVFEIMFLIGKTETVSRIKTMINKLK